MPRHSSRPALPPRVVAIGLVLSVHGLLVLLLVSGSRVHPRTLGESSFVRNPELPRAGFTKTPIPLPFVRLGERCVVGLGFFACNMSPLPEPNSHLFDDMKEGKTQESSVPDPNICD